MPYVEGFGTWPFGEEWLWEAVACRLPAAARPARARRGPGHGRPDAGAVRPARDPAGRGGRPARRLPRRDRAGSCTTRTRPASTAPASPSWRPRCGAQRATTRAPPRRSGPIATSSRRSRLADSGACELWTSSATPRGAAAARHRRGPAPAGGYRGRGARAPLRRPGRAGSGYPSARTRRASSATSPTMGVRVDLRRPDGRPRPRRARAARARADRGRRGGGTDRLADGPARVGRRARLPGRPPCYRDYHHRTNHDLRPWNIGGEPVRRGRRAAAAPPSTRATSWPAASQRLDAYAEERGRPGLLCCALDTELLGPLVVRGPGLAGGGGRPPRARRASS